MRVQVERALSNSRRKLPKGDNSPPNGRRGRRGEIRRSWTRLSTLATFVARQRDGGQTGSDFSSVYRSFHRHYLSAAARRKHLFRTGILGRWRRVMRYRYIYKITSAASLACLTLLRLLGPPTSRPVTRSFVPTSLSRIPLSFSLSLSPSANSGLSIGYRAIFAEPQGAFSFRNLSLSLSEIDALEYRGAKT